jgi:hypothetical protein
MIANNHGNELIQVRVRDADGRVLLANVTPLRSRRLAELARAGSSVRVSVDANGMVTAILGRDDHRSLDRVLARFGLDVDPPEFNPFIPPEWEDLLEQWLEVGSPANVLLYGPEGTGKDTLVKVFFQRIVERHGADKVAVLTIPTEERDGIVGHLEKKASDFGEAVMAAKEAGMIVAAYLPEIESIFAAGDYCGSWEHQYKAKLRDTLDGSKAFRADYLLGATNSLARLGGPLLSRFQKHEIGMNAELARGILRTHWPVELTNGLSSDHVAERLTRETIAEATLASRKKIPLRAPDLTAFNGRFLSHLAADLKRRAKIRRRKDDRFHPDRAFVDEVLAAHLREIIAPAAEAAGTRAGAGEFLARRIDRLDPPIVIEPTLDWCDSGKYLAS